MFRGLREVFVNDEEIINLINDGNLSEIEELNDEDENDGDELAAAEDVTRHPRTDSSTNAAINGVNGGQNDQPDPIDDLFDEAMEVVVEEPIIEEGDSGFYGIPTCNTLDEEVKQYFTTKALTPKKDVKWRCVDAYETSIERFYEPDNAVLLETKSPLEYFQSYFNDAFWMETVNFTNLYAEQQNVPHFPPTNLDEMKTFVGIHIVMGNLSYPRVRMYWEPKFAIPIIHDNMSRKRFQKLRQCIHFCDNTQNPPNNTDRFWKVRPLYNAIKQTCSQFQLEPNMCIDEQMVPFKGQLSCKQYIKNKPTKWGIKVFMLCGESGLTYDFIIYQGNTTELDPIHSKLGQGLAVVMHLVQRITVPNIHLYFDNYFNSYWLLQLLGQKDIYAAGTAIVQRFAKPSLATSKEMKARGRGAFQEVVSDDGIIMTQWNDNSIVSLASNFIGSGNANTCRRWDKTEKAFIHVPRPEVVNRYNNSMGGVDKVDFLIAIYRIFIRSKKWTLRMFTHAIDLAVTNSWLEYIRDAKKLDVPKSKRLDLIHFRQNVAEALILSGRTAEKKRGRPSNDITPPPPPKRKHSIRPVEDIRYDGIDHLPSFDEQLNASRCKNPGCKQKTHVCCSKCKIYLCITRKNNCFYNFHKK